jgi:hypothetical protein
MTYLSKKRSFEVAVDKDLQSWIKACISNKSRPADQDFPQTLFESEGLLPWLAYRLHESGALESLPTVQQEDLRLSLRRWSLMHLDCESELEKVILSAETPGIRFLAFKGHSVSRTLYPNPACRPTSDFDLLIDPGQVKEARAWLADMSYSPLQNYVGTVWLGAQSWSSSEDSGGRFHVDLHWDYSNRMYFRHRLGFEDIWDGSLKVPCGDSMLRVPCRVDDLILACVHLAAFDPGLHIRLIWLLDIYLLMAALSEPDLSDLLERAQAARAVEACLVFGERAAELGETEKVRPVLEALAAVASEQRMKFYDWTLRSRAFDLGAYWLRLPLKEKAVFFGDLIRWVKIR